MAGSEQDVAYPAGATCAPEEEVLCVWGATFTFTAAGEVPEGTTRIGRLDRLTLRDRVAAGESFSVAFDSLSTNIGTIRPGGQYSVSFMPVERAWNSDRDPGSAASRRNDRSRG